METSSLLWQQFAQKNQLSEQQLAQFQQYYQMLIAANELFNITTITDLAGVLAYHFEDSIKLRECYDFSSVQALCDVGTGGGFPGIPLKIMFPHIRVTLLEVSQKKVAFLNSVITQLGLLDINTCDLDCALFCASKLNRLIFFVHALRCTRMSWCVCLRDHLLIKQQH